MPTSRTAFLVLTTFFILSFGAFVVIYITRPLLYEISAYLPHQNIGVILILFLLLFLSNYHNFSSKARCCVFVSNDLTYSSVYTIGSHLTALTKVVYILSLFPLTEISILGDLSFHHQLWLSSPFTAKVTLLVIFCISLLSLIHSVLEILMIPLFLPYLNKRF